MKILIKRKTIFVALFIALLSLAGLGQFSPDVGAADANATLPPPGGTIPPNSTGIQILHLAPFGTDTTVDASISDGNISATYNGIRYGESTGGYLAVTPGPVNGFVTPISGGTPLNFSTTVAPNTGYTTAFIGGAKGWPLEFITLEDTTTASPALFGKVRIVHAAPFAPSPTINTAINVVDQLGNSVDDAFNGLTYKENSGYVELPIGRYQWSVTLPGTNTTVVDLDPFILYSGAALTIYITGDGTLQPASGLYAIQELGKEPTFMYFAVLINN